MRADCVFRLQSPAPSGTGGVAIVQLRGDVGGALAKMGLAELSPGRFGLRAWTGVDQVLVARIGPEVALLFPHAGAANVRRVLETLEAAGLHVDEGASAADEFPDAKDELEARLLSALARAESPLAVDVLLDQPGRWERVESGTNTMMSPEESRVLRRLIEPPLIVALGAPNIGKSSLLNALAGRRVALVADEAGTTRDHVGVTLDLGGLVVRYFDTPGIDLPGIDPAGAKPNEVQSKAQALALQAARSADLVLLCADSGSEYVDLPHLPVERMRTGLRADLGEPREGCDLAVSARTGAGLETLAGAVRERLVPGRLIADERAWEFW